MNCVMCNIKLEYGKTEVKRWKEGEEIIFINVPALICPNCKEVYLDSREIDIINNRFNFGTLSKEINFDDLTADKR